MSFVVISWGEIWAWGPAPSVGSGVKLKFEGTSRFQYSVIIPTLCSVHGFLPEKRAQKFICICNENNIWNSKYVVLKQKIYF